MTDPTARDLIQRLADALAEYDDANLYHDDAALLAETRAYLDAHPEPAAGPTDEELDALAQPFLIVTEDGTGFVDDHCGYARAVLARYGHQPPQPIPLSERLPTEADCDAEGRCWVGYAAFTDETGDIAADYNCSWELCKAVIPGDEVWLPAHALPLPSTLDV